MKQPDLQEGHSQWVIVRCQNGYERAVQRELLARIEENAMHSTIREVIHPSDANPLAMVGLPSERGRKYPG